MIPRPRCWLIGVGALVALVAWLCARSPVPGVDPATAASLEAASETWWQPGGQVRGIPEGEWPPEVRRLGPEAVTVTAEGVYFQFRSFLVTSSGLFVLPRGSPFDPPRDGDPSYRQLQGRVYRYEIAG